MATDATYRVHWFRFSTAHELGEISDVLGGLDSPDRKGGFNQPLSSLHVSGARVFHGSENVQQPNTVEVGGDACDSVGSAELARWGVELAGRVTRIDLAADVEPAELARSRLLGLRRAFRAGRCMTRLKRTNLRWFQSDVPGDGSTLYLGSTASEFMARFYDRRGPLRLEFQWKPQQRSEGEVVPRLLASFGAAALWRGLACRVSFNASWYQELLIGDSVGAEGEAEPATGLSDFIEVVRKQFGGNIWALQQLGISLDDLAVEPNYSFNREQRLRHRLWCDEAPSLSLDARKLAEAVH
jgi:hypothetical protein